MHQLPPDEHHTPALLVNPIQESPEGEAHGVQSLRRGLGQMRLEAFALTVRLQSMSAALIAQAFESLAEKDTPEPSTAELTDDDLVAYV